jgi:hypothetical protein
VNLPVLPSTLLMTVLMLVGLVFFIRASVKDRTQQIRYPIDPTNDSLLNDLKAHFLQRAYRVVSIDPSQQKMTLEGFVRPSLFLALFLSVLAGCGLLCVSLLLSFFYPPGQAFFPSLILLSPLAGGFYWRQAGRLEQISIQLETIPLSSPSLLSSGQCYVTITAHRDELSQLQRSFSQLTFS